jgi:hypothetical protein
MNNINVSEIFEKAKNDPELFANIDIDELLNAIQDDSTDYLDNKTINTINDDIFKSLYEIGYRGEQLKEYCEKLIGYRLVNEVFELHKGKLVKTIRIFDDDYKSVIPKLRMHGKVSNIKFLDNGTHVVCMMFINGRFSNRYVQYKFDQYLTFQKLSDDENLILLTYEYLSNNNK